MDERTREQLQVGRELYHKGEYERAERILSEVLRESDQYADVHHMVGFILHARLDLAGAERHFERAVELNPNYTEALMNLAVTYNDLGKYEASRQVYARIKRPDAKPGELDPYVRGKIANMHAEVAQAYLDAGAHDEAIFELKKAISLGPGFPDLWARLGSIHRDMGSFSLAKEAYEAALSVAPRYAHARILLGVTLLSMGDMDAAIATWKEVLAVEPENKSAKMYLRMAEGQRSRASSASEQSTELIVFDTARIELDTAQIGLDAGRIEIDEEPGSLEPQRMTLEPQTIPGIGGPRPSAPPAPQEKKRITVPPPPSSPTLLLDSIDMSDLPDGGSR